MDKKRKFGKLIDKESVFNFLYRLREEEICMCTCITYQNSQFYFGRNMDLAYSFQEKIVITPRNYTFPFKRQEKIQKHYAMIGMATVLEDYPLYAEAVNEKGLCMAGLNFPDNAVYQKEENGLYNITPFELIPWVLSQCASVSDAKQLLVKTNIVAIPFQKDIPLAPLHWMLADEEKSIVLEPMEDGLKIYENPYGVLTNNPAFGYHKMNLMNYLNLTSAYPDNRFSKEIDLKPYAQGMGAIGLPGDASSASRFIRAVFLKFHSDCKKDELSCITQVFHMLEGVSMMQGSVVTEEGEYDRTTYSCCVNAKKGIYYYRIYENSQICAVQLLEEHLDIETLICYPLVMEQKIHYINRK